ncbi:N-acetyllactosaminide beta-1,3-N-acetylglucosaminyltransferase 3-like isoform X1 [Cyprinodon tularosa]|uniref:N-acetyllactosaminide beta-1,3-N-acetylglucosaminyltransferase 3-like isoform X1 n=2 Tax=Cyprinodon tularosa TaxID=77115 RepID=UPI0018E25BE3|nr:N-acetyllactosaminide beta-1,3-N-acetylglucosaminyltransferase 3-like isoform X1 [Cyprinodon tularosa]
MRISTGLFEGTSITNMVRLQRLIDICAMTSLLLVAMLLLVFFNDPQNVSYLDLNNTDYPRAAYAEQNPNASHKIYSLLKQRLKGIKVNQSQRCEPNTTIANVSGFDTFSPMIQDFLYYRHCRSFPLLLDLPEKCGRDDEPEDVFLLLVIKSSPKNYEHREVLRKTWAKERLYKGKMIRRIFIIGTDGLGFEKEKLNKLVALEHQHYNDILQWDFKDSFYNLTLKQILFLEWMESRCSQARFLLNGDDDVFAHTDNMIDYLQHLKDNDGSKHLFIGDLLKISYPKRDQRSKYYVPHVVYEKNVYPPYCGGGGYLLSGYTALVIYKMSAKVQFIPIDDVYMGMCLAAVKLEPKSHMGVKTLGWYIPSKNFDKYDPCYMRDLLLIHKFPPKDLYFLWHEVHNPRLQCDKL